MRKDFMNRWIILQQQYLGQGEKIKRYREIIDQQKNF